MLALVGRKGKLAMERFEKAFSWDYMELCLVTNRRESSKAIGVESIRIEGELGGSGRGSRWKL